MGLVFVLIGRRASDATGNNSISPPLGHCRNIYIETVPQSQSCSHTHQFAIPTTPAPVAMDVDKSTHDTAINAKDPEKHAASSDDEDSQNAATNHKHMNGVVPEEQDVPWTFKRVLAIASLCMVYVGEQPT